MNKISLSYEDLELIGRALIAYRWNVENQDGQTSEFHKAAAIEDRIACNHNGATLVFSTEDGKDR
ncbi:TPA: hypothetical protein ACVOYJ_004725 [Vibrio diabolicus]